MKRLRVAITGISSADRPGPGAAIALSLREDTELDLDLIGLACEAEGPESCAHWIADATCVMPLALGEGDAYLHRLLQIQSEFGLDLIIPSLDAELPFFIKHAPLLAEYGIHTFVPTLHHYALRRRDMLGAVARGIDLRTPRTRVVRTAAALDQAIDDIGLPLMLKGLYNKAYRVREREEARLRFNELGAEWGLPVVVQEVIAGDELYVVGVGDGQGRSLGALGFRKVTISDENGIWTGVAHRHEQLLEAAQKFIVRSRWRGPFELACMLRKGELYLVDLHPRFPVWSHLAVGQGLNLAARLVRQALNPAPIRAQQFHAGREFLQACTALQPAAAALAVPGN
jgi:carbamoyl-phosphate synthase large subunit